MKIAVLGASGFIGTHLVDDLLNDGHEVIGLGRSQDPGNRSRKGYTYVSGDISQSWLIKDVVAAADVCFHLISSTTPATAEVAPAADIAANLVPSIKLIEQLSRTTHRTRLIFVSSGGTVYGNAQTIPTPEEAPLAPLSVYGLTKATTERYVQLVGDASGLDYLILRPSNVYGPTNNENAFGIINHYLRKIKRGEPIEIWGTGSNIRDYLYIDDLISSLKMAISYSSTNKIINIGSGQGHSIIEVVRLAESAVGKKSTIQFRNPRRIDVATSVLDVRRAAMELGWSAKIELADGIRRVARSLHNSP